MIARDREFKEFLHSKMRIAEFGAEKINIITAHIHFLSQTTGQGGCSLDKKER